MKTQWEVYFVGKATPVIVTGKTFQEAYVAATAISPEIMSIKYLAY